MTRPDPLLGAALSALLLAATPAAAQQALVFGRTVSGELTADDARVEDGGYRYDEWTFSTREGQRVELTLTAADFDAYLEVWAANSGTDDGPQWSDDDSLSGTDARLRFSAPAGDWIVRARGFESEALGAYALTLAERPPAPRAPRPTGVRVGRAVQGDLSDRDPETGDGVRYDAYALRMRQGERVLATLTSDAFDPMLQVGRGVGEEFVELGVNDDDGQGLNSRLVFEAPSSGEFVIRVTPVGADDGAYVLTLAEAPPAAPAAALGWGASVQGDLSPTDGVNADGAVVDVYRFTGTAGQRAQIDVTSSAFDAYVELRAESDPSQVLAEDDDGGPEGTDSRLLHTLPADGEYRVEVRAFAPGGVGAYTVSLTEAAPERPATPLAFGAAVEGQIEDADPRDSENRGYDSYVFSGVEGQRVQAILRSGDFDAFLRVGSAEGEFSDLASDDDGLGEGTDSRLNFTVPADGDYVLRVSPLGPDADGLYAVELIDRGPKPQPGSLIVGASVRGVLSENDDAAADGSWFDSYRVHAKAGEPLRIELASNAFDAFVMIGREKDDGGFEVLGSDDDSLSDTHARLDWEAPEDGDYVIRAGSFGAQEAGRYVLTVKPQPKP
ncbi:MAG TPA: PPC domain-containing protein [Brevundimonas sp.]|uniref:PPC domain-containing protein n=1 Tax=Brevundimonas sp. TaxID=1871086 RepID=UPI002DF2542C|nr:PPC domain-containing protein [Brevundimonas sp.]